MVKSELIFNPYKREDIWRFFSYQFLHAGFHHIFGNMLFQLVFGIPLEMVHGTLRIGSVYTMGKYEDCPKLPIFIVIYKLRRYIIYKLKAF